MGSFLCRCGMSIPLRDVPYLAEARFIPNCDQEAFFASCGARIGEFLSAIEEGKRAEWITEEISSYCVNWSNQEIVAKLLLFDCWLEQRSMLECAECGRIYLQGKQSDGYVSFRPEPVIIYDPPHITQLERIGEGEPYFIHKTHSNWNEVDCEPVPAELRRDFGRLINPEPDP